MPRHAFLATLDDAGALRRLDQAIAAALPAISRRRARDLIARGSVWVDGARVRTQGRLLRAGQRVDVADDVLVIDDALPPVLVERPDAVVVDKPSGVACEPTRQAAASVTDSFARAGRPLQAVHRLDVDTSGVLLLAPAPAVAQWARVFHDGHVTRTYLAIVAGHVEGDDGVVDAALLPPDKEGRARVSVAGKPSQTAWRVVARGDGADLLVVTPLTGRTHQIRVHFAHIGHPLIGDHRYAVRQPGASHLGLHALRLACAPDGAAPLDVTAPPPAAFVATASSFGIADALAAVAAVTAGAAGAAP